MDPNSEPQTETTTSEVGEEPYEVLKFEDWDELKQYYVDKLSSTRWVFRGQREASWGITSSLQRATKGLPTLDAEKYFINLFKRRAHNYVDSSHLPDEKDLLEWLALMQHHGAPTRLVDFTRSPYVASFFALEDAGDRCAVWAIDTKWCRDEAILVIAENFDDYRFLDWRMNLRDPKRLGKCFENVVIENQLPLVLPVEPWKMNERLTIQQGLFMCPGDVQAGFEDNLKCGDTAESREHWKKIIISAEARRLALHDLFWMNVNRATLFPGIDGFAQSLKHQLYSADAEQFTWIQEESFLKEILDTRSQNRDHKQEH